MSKRYLPFGDSASKPQSALRELMTQEQLDKQRDTAQRKGLKDAAEAKSCLRGLQGLYN
jgi:hypothetical protein